MARGQRKPNPKKRPAPDSQSDGSDAGSSDDRSWNTRRASRLSEEPWGIDIHHRHHHHRLPPIPHQFSLRDLNSPALETHLLVVLY